MTKWLNLFKEKNKERNTLEANQEQLKESNGRAYQEFRKDMYLLEFILTTSPYGGVFVGVHPDIATPEIKEKIKKFEREIFREFKSVYDEILDSRINDYIKLQASRSIHDWFKHLEEQYPHDPKRYSHPILPEHTHPDDFLHDEFLQGVEHVRSDDSNTTIHLENNSVDDKHEEKEKNNNELNRIESKFKELPFFVSFGQINAILNLTQKQYHQQRSQIMKCIRTYKFGEKSYRYKKSDILKFFNIELPSVESDPLKYLKKIKPKYLTRVSFYKILSISDTTFSSVQKEIDKLVPPLMSAFRGQIYKKSDIIKFIERGGLDAH